MLIGPDSYFRKLPGDNRKQALLIDGIRYSIQMSDLAYESLKQMLGDLSLRYFQPEFKLHDEGVAVMLQAWSIIDSVHRIRCLLNQTPSLNQKEPYLRLFYDSTRTIEDMRNCVQHQTSEVEEYIKHDSTIWGVLSWCYKPDPAILKVFSFVLIPGTMFQAKEHHLVNPSGRSMSLPVGLITLSVNDMILCLSDVLGALAKLAPELETRVKSICLGKAAAGSDALVAAELDFAEAGSGVRIAQGDRLGIGVNKSSKQNAK